MALTKQPFIADLGSQQMDLVTAQANALATWVDAFKTAVAGAVDYAAFQAAVAALDVSALRELVATRRLPGYRRFPTK